MAFLQALLDGCLIGSVYAVVSIGLTLVFGVMGIVNFAHAQFLTMGMFIAFFLWKFFGLDPLLGAFIALVAVFVIGAILQRVLIRPILKAPPAAQIFLTVGLLIVIENGNLMLFGSEFKSVHTPYQTTSLKLGALFLNVPYLLAFVMSCASGLAVWWYLHKTSYGRAIRATAQDPMAATLSGINTDRMQWIAFGLGTGLTAFGGAVILPYFTVYPSVGSQFVVLMFTVVVLGGLGSVTGCMLGGMLVGVIQSLSTLVFPMQLQNLVLFLLFIAMLSFRPAGLLGKAS
jgi:branched-chain amino acid transport system permease protein